ncbi:AraC-like DNA-binding protein [Filimonas zeae]|uniref:HTH araC/xylS-type domain-containing protein n=1 Tax=Filimonas zeae TaxID=1737353 RepID=A0A917MTD2_9BACT|nr:DUF6597 domain-containing transcriptional factor [Filimonas zeae]MDR6339532.1 AraC-like DNA-binding protein [Filimonas zeae]GGH63185.1 hypothetical protein GCM10011379_13790 [Filimonas zeae]
MPGEYKMETFDYIVQYPDAAVAPFVESYWMVKNHSAAPKEIVLLPDGRVDLILSCAPNEPFEIRLMGLSTGPDSTSIQPGTLLFAISFRLLAGEYLFGSSLASLLNSSSRMPELFWNFLPKDLNDFPLFCIKAGHAIQRQMPDTIDNRKEALFQLLYSTNGNICVQELADQTYWSSRQINRYFRDHYGLPLKAYSNILRFRASFPHIKAGRLFPEQDFADQPHFIKEIKKLSGARPKDLFKNENDRFIQFSTLHKI